MSQAANPFEETTFVTTIYATKAARVDIRTEVYGALGEPATTMWVVYADGLAVEVVNFSEALEQM